MSKKPRGNKKFLQLEIEEKDDPLEQSNFSQFGPSLIKFTTHNIEVSEKGLTNISKTTQGPQFHSLTKDEIQVIGALGKGASAQVHEGILLPFKMRVAIKSINVFEQEKRHQLMNDLSALLKHKGSSQEAMACPFLVELYGAYYDEGSVKVVLELMDCGSLSDVVKKTKKHHVQEPYIEEPILARIAQQILNGLMYLHIMGHQIHRDIKPANILINKKGEVKLTDFGIVKELEMTNQLVLTQKGTVAYMSPETLEGDKINYLCDIWSFGLVMIELARGEYPYPVKRPPGFIEMRDLIAKDPLDSFFKNEVYSSDFRHFVGRCLVKAPKDRASAIELLSHPWILKNLYKHVDLKGWIKKLWEEPQQQKAMDVIDEKEEIQKDY